jgi:alpha-D-ribose 1-methylphosphonate 5-triphosphate synthase subunit PhnH
VSAPAAPPPPLHRATAAVLLTLLDADTPLWLDDAALAVRDWIAFHAGAPSASRTGAAFGLAVSATSLAGFVAGSDEGPETSATLILQVAALGAGRALRLSGPGLAAPTTLRVDGLAADFVAEWAANHRLFPRGIDLVLCAGNHLAAFPRTLQIEAL